jgi:hypothetical protein
MSQPANDKSKNHLASSLDSIVVNGFLRTILLKLMLQLLYQQDQILLVIQMTLMEGEKQCLLTD